MQLCCKQLALHVLPAWLSFYEAGGNLVYGHDGSRTQPLLALPVMHMMAACM